MLNRPSKTRTDSTRGGRSFFILIALAGSIQIAAWSVASWTSAAEPAPSPGDEIASLVRALDDPKYDARSRAREKLIELTQQKELQPLLAEQFRSVLAKEGVSYEVRSVLVDLRRALPATETAGKAEVGQADIERLLDEMSNDSFAQRVGAQQRLTALLDDPAAGVQIMNSLKTRLAADAGKGEAGPDNRRVDWDEMADGEQETGEDKAAAPNVDAIDEQSPGEDRQPLITLWRDVRGRWLSSPTEWPLPKVEEKQWRDWIADVCRPGDDLDVRARRNVATRELRDLLTREAYAVPVQEALKKQLDYTGDSPATKRIERLLEWLHPAMVAEVWSDGLHVTIQHLLVDVPQVPDGAPRTTHFDRIDDRIAHCVSGNSLEPGDYRVGVAIPHPKGLNMMFHLINLPTPRRRMAYKYSTRRSQTERRREISERTLAAVLEEKRLLTPTELAMLHQLDPHSVSRFVEPYFKAAPDRPIKSGDGYPTTFTTEHEVLCSALIDFGTHEAIDALQKDALARQVDVVSPKAQYPIAWIAILAIAERDPWEAMDSWLASLIERDTSLAPSLNPAPEVGATAAFMLLRRHEQSPRAFGLIEVQDDVLQSSGVTGYRFSEPADRAAVQNWWSKHKAPPAALNARG